MTATLASVPDRRTRGGETERSWWGTTTDGEPAVAIHDDVVHGVGANNELAALERRAREQCWVCEWWPPT
jgi:hypothetical protein